MATEPQRKALAIVALAEMFDKSLSEAGVRMYVSALEDLAADSVEHAAANAAKTCQRMPAPVELRELAGEVRHDDRAALAWEAFSRAVSEVGGYKSTDFDDPLINATCRMLGGWERWTGMTEAEFDKWGRQEFVKTYQGLLRSGVNGDLTAPLVGICEHQNRTLGYDRQEDRAKVETGLPWADEQVKRLPQREKTGAQPRITFQTP